MRRWVWEHPITFGFVLMFVYITVVGGFLFNRLDGQQDTQAAQQARFNAESLRARSSNCLQFERDHLRDVNQLRQTYAYLEQLHPSELKDAINRFVIARLPETEKKAQTDTAPGYCDRPGLGLPEPDPVVPMRPSFLRR